MLDPTSRHEPMVDVYTGLRQRECVSAGCRHDNDLGRHATTAHLRALDGIGRLEHERARHHGKRKVERDVEEEGAEECRALHVSDSTRCEGAYGRLLP